LKFNKKKRGMKEVTAPDQEESNPTSEFVDKDTIDTLATTTNLCSITNEIEDLENSGIHIKNTIGCEDIHRVNLLLHAVELRQLPPYQLLEYLEKIWEVPR
jgi:hypothetical protein